MVRKSGPYSWPLSSESARGIMVRKSGPYSFWT